MLRRALVRRRFECLVGPRCRRWKSSVVELPRVRIADGEEGFEHMLEPTSVFKALGSKEVRFSTGEVGPFADALVQAEFGETSVQVSVVTSPTASEGEDFLPLQVEYREKSFAAGVIPATFTRREMAVMDREVLGGRIVDRSIRPLFPAGYNFETQLVASVTSVDADVPPEPLAVMAASAALRLSSVPWSMGVGPIGAVVVGFVPGLGPVVHPTAEQREASVLSMLYAGTSDRTLMLEVGANELGEADLVDALYAGQAALAPLIALQEELQEGRGKRKRNVGVVVDPQLRERAKEAALVELEKHFPSVHKKVVRSKFHAQAIEAAKRAIASEAEGQTKQLTAELATDDAFRTLILRASTPTTTSIPVHEGGKTSSTTTHTPAAVVGKDRPDGRTSSEIRPVRGRTGVLPVVHGSSLFARGHTQVLCTTTLGPPEIAQLQRTAGGAETEERKPFFLHYEFPPFSVNEVGQVGGANRRAVGHGALAEKAIAPVMPAPELFPYTVRVTSTVTGSDGSSSMATICGSSLALMDAGVPLTRPVAGISLGMVSSPSLDDNWTQTQFGNADKSEEDEDGEYVLLMDILGMEDHFGDMDFKVGGTVAGITAVQMDIKRAGLPLSVLEDAVWRARDGRLAVLEAMSEVQARAREELKASAPRMELLPLPLHRRSAVLGPGGSVLRRLERESGARLRVMEDADYIQVFASSETSLNQARDLIEQAVAGRIPAMIAGPVPVGGAAALIPPPLSSSTSSSSTSSSSSSFSSPPLRLVVGETQWVRVEEVRDFGALVVPVRIPDAPAGLLHVTDLGPDPSSDDSGEKEPTRRDMRDLVKPGTLLRATVIDVDLLGRGRFSRIDALNTEGKRVWDMERRARTRGIEEVVEPKAPKKEVEKKSSEDFEADESTWEHAEAADLLDPNTYQFLDADVDPSAWKK